MEELIDVTALDEGPHDCVGELANAPDYKNSRYVVYNRWSNAPEVDALVAFLVSGMVKKKADPYRMNMKVIVLDLYDCYLSDPDQFIGYHRGHDHYNFRLKIAKDNGYVTNPHITHTGFVGCVDFLIANGYVTNKDGGHFYSETLHKYYGLLTKMRPTSNFAALCTEYGLNPRMIGKYAEEEVIILKDVPVKKTINGRKVKIKREVQYDDTPKVKKMREQVREYNAYLERCHIDVDLECMTDTDKEEFARTLLARKQMNYEKIRLGSKSVYRVFNNNSFNQGGRYYGAFWIGCPSLLRKYITINGKKTVELDYSGIHVQLLYAIKGINYAALGEDAYTLGENNQERELNKLILLTAFNAEGEKPTAQSIYNQLKKEGKLDKYAIKGHEPIKLKLAQLKRKHAPIEEFISKGYGVHLQYYDSCIIEKLIEYAVSHDIPILTIHDSVVCPEQDADFIKDKMWQYYRDFTEEQFGVDIAYKSIQPNAKPFSKCLLQSAKYPIIPHSHAAMSAIIGIDLSKYKYAHGVYGKKTPIIKVKEEAAEFRCTKECNHNKRVKEYKNKNYVYMRDISIRLSKGRTLVVV